MQTFSLYLFDSEGRKIGNKATVIDGVNIEAISPEVKKKIESFPLGALNAILVYRVNGVDEIFETRYTQKDYLLDNIPHKKTKKVSA